VLASFSVLFFPLRSIALLTDLPLLIAVLFVREYSLLRQNVVHGQKKNADGSEAESPVEEKGNSGEKSPIDSVAGNAEKAV
jgi:hypothetical protein